MLIHRPVFQENYTTSASRPGQYPIDSGLWGLAKFSIISCLVAFLSIREGLGLWKSIGLHMQNVRLFSSKLCLRL